MKNVSVFRKIMCPFCHSLESWIGNKGKKKLLGCGCLVHFVKTRSQKEMDRRYIKTEYGLELIK